MALLRWDHELNIHLPDGGASFDKMVDAATHKKVAHVCKHERLRKARNLLFFLKLFIHAHGGSNSAPAPELFKIL